MLSHMLVITNRGKPHSHLTPMTQINLDQELDKTQLQ